MEEVCEVAWSIIGGDKNNSGELSNAVACIRANIHNSRICWRDRQHIQRVKIGTTHQVIGNGRPRISGVDGLIDLRGAEINDVCATGVGCKRREDADEVVWVDAIDGWEKSSDCAVLVGSVDGKTGDATDIHRARNDCIDRGGSSISALLVVHPSCSALKVLTAVVLSASERDGRLAGVDGNEGIKLREGEPGVVEIGPGHSGGFGIVGAPHAAVVAEVHADLAGGKLNEGNGVIVHVRKSRAAAGEIGNYRRPTGSSVCRANDPGRISARIADCSAAKENYALVVGIHFNDVVVPTLKMADVGRGGLRPGTPSIRGNEDPEIGFRGRAGIGNGGVDRVPGSVAGGDAQVNAAHAGLQWQRCRGQARETDCGASGTDACGLVDAVAIGSVWRAAKRIT